MASDRLVHTKRISPREIRELSVTYDKGGINTFDYSTKQPEEAARLASGKKGEIVDYIETLFAAPFATLSPEQRDAVETWCPPGMEIPAPKSRPGGDAEPDEDADDGFIDEVPFENGDEEIDLAGDDEGDGEEEEIDLSDADADADADPNPAETEPA